MSCPLKLIELVFFGSISASHWLKDHIQKIRVTFCIYQSVSKILKCLKVDISRETEDAFVVQGKCCRVSRNQMQIGAKHNKWVALTCLHRNLNMKRASDAVENLFKTATGYSSMFHVMSLKEEKKSWDSMSSQWKAQWQLMTCCVKV